MFWDGILQRCKIDNRRSSTSIMYMGLEAVLEMLKSRDGPVRKRDERDLGMMECW